MADNNVAPGAGSFIENMNLIAEYIRGGSQDIYIGTKIIGERTVDELNLIDMSLYFAGDSWYISTDGMITNGSRDVLVTVGDFAMWADEGYFVNMGKVSPSNLENVVLPDLGGGNPKLIFVRADQTFAGSLEYDSATGAISLNRISPDGLSVHGSLTIGSDGNVFTKGTDPVEEYDLTTKRYTDGLVASFGDPVQKAGDTMTGDLLISDAGGTQRVTFVRADGTVAGSVYHSDTTEQVVLSRYQADGLTIASQLILGSDGVSIDGPDSTDAVIEGDHDIVTKLFADTELAKKLNVSGGTITGDLSIDGSLDVSEVSGDLDVLGLFAVGKSDGDSGQINLINGLNPGNPGINIWGAFSNQVGRMFVGTDNEFIMTHYNDGATAETEFTLAFGNASLTSAEDVPCMATDPTHITTKKYVDERAPFAPVFEFVKAAPVLGLPETTPTLVATLTVPALPAGDYVISYSFAVDFKGLKDKSVHFREDIDGVLGSTFDVQSDKKSNNKNRLYGYPKTRVAGDFLMEFYMWKETGVTEVIDVNFCDLMIERKK